MRRALVALLLLGGTQDPFGHAIFTGADPSALVERDTVWLYPTDGERRCVPGRRLT